MRLPALWCALLLGAASAWAQNSGLPAATEETAAAFEAIKAGALASDSTLRAAACESLRIFVQQHPAAAQAPEALAMLAGQEDRRAAIVDWLHLAYEYPTSPLARQAKSEYLDLVKRKMTRRAQAAMSALVQTPESADLADRLAQVVYGLAESSGDALYEPAVAEARRFQVRFPAFHDGDRILWSLARLHLADGKNAAALMAYRQLAAYRGSPYREQAQFAVGTLLADRLKKFKEAAEAFQEFITQFPQSAEIPRVLERLAVLYADRFDQPALAVETYERIIKGYPKSDYALKAFNGEAKLQRGRLKQPLEAMKTWQRLTEQFRYPEAVAALLAAAEIARKDLKDYKQEVELRMKIASDFPTATEASEQLYQAAQVTEHDLNDSSGAVKIYRQVIALVPADRLGRKARDRADKLEPKKSP